MGLKSQEGELRSLSLWYLSCTIPRPKFEKEF